MRSKFKWIFTLLVAFTMQFSFAQQKTVTGVVSDAMGPLAGANVVVKGTTNGTTTDFDGNYTIQAKQGDVLEVTYTGMKKTTVTVGASNVVNVTMQEDILTGNEVVVVAYGAEKKSNVTSAVSVVKAESIEQVPIASLDQVLQGNVAGLQMAVGSGQPGQSGTIRIRGKSSLDKKQEPLYIIDGKPAKEEDFRKLNPKDIEKVVVLKDEKSTALYGNRGKNGAVTIITKNGLPIEKKDKLIKEIAPFDNSIPSIEPNQEDYELFVENPFTSPKSEPLSTFSIDVDNASYTNVRRFINQGQTVPKDAVRVEEMVNFFKYNYEKPTGNHPFAIATEYGDCPWNEKHKLVKIGLQGKEIPNDKLPNSNFVFLIDVSGSMNSQNKLPLLKESMKVLVNQLRKNDKVAIVVYAGAAGMVLPPTSGDEKETIIKALDKLSAGGSTAGGAGIELAYKIAAENFIKGGNNRVILATDGDFNVGASSNKDMETLIEEKRKSGVFLTCLGYGMGNYKDSKMEILANKGNGNYAYIDNIQEANRFLGKEFKGSMFAIAKDVKIQIEFNPKHVQSYRLIGYENRKLRPEDFKNDAIDAGELGSGHTVTALYEIIPTGVESTFNQDIADLKYSEIKIAPKDYSDELATIKFRYKKPDGEKSIEIVETIKNNVISLAKTSEDFKFSAAVAWFGLKLRDSKLVTNKTSKDIKALALQGKSKDEDGYRSEFIRLVEAVN